jgi:hypothetical protein
VIRALSVKDFDSLLQQMRIILATEGKVASFIGHHFQTMANDARLAKQDGKSDNTIRDSLVAFRSALVSERRVLIQQEIELYSMA